MRSWQLRESSLFVALSKLTGDMQASLKKFRVSYLAIRRCRTPGNVLDHALKMTNDAAHRTMISSNNRTDRRSRLQSVGGAGGIVAALSEHRNRNSRSAAMMNARWIHDGRADRRRHGAQQSQRSRHAQGYQDLSGQIIRKRRALVGSLESHSASCALGAIARQVRRHRRDRKSQDVRPGGPGQDQENVSGQQEVDSLLSGLGLFRSG